MVVNHAKLADLPDEPIQTEFFTEEQQRYCDCFSAVTADVLAQVSQEPVQNAFRQVAFEDYDDKTHTLLLQVPDKKFYAWIEGQKIRPFFVSHIKQHFPCIEYLNYRIMKK